VAGFTPGRGGSLTVTVLDGEMKSLWDKPVHTTALRW